jgi:hypothetical protein
MTERIGEFTTYEDNENPYCECPYCRSVIRLDSLVCRSCSHNVEVFMDGAIDRWNLHLAEQSRNIKIGFCAAGVMLVSLILWISI